MEFLIDHFDDLFNYEYTRHLEERLDDITEDKVNQNEIYDSYFNDIKSRISSMIVKEKGIQIDEQNKLVIGKRGSVIVSKEEGETIYTRANQDIDLDKLRNGEYKMEEIVNKTNSFHKGSFMDEEIINVIIFIYKS